MQAGPVKTSVGPSSDLEPGLVGLVPEQSVAQDQRRLVERTARRNPEAHEPHAAQVLHRREHAWLHDDGPAASGIGCPLGRHRVPICTALLFDRGERVLRDPSKPDPIARLEKEGFACPRSNRRTGVRPMILQPPAVSIE